MRYKQKIKRSSFLPYFTHLTAAINILQHRN